LERETERYYLDNTRPFTVDWLPSRSIRMPLMLAKKDSDDHPNDVFDPTFYKPFRVSYYKNSRVYTWNNNVIGWLNGKLYFF